MRSPSPVSLQDCLPLTTASLELPAFQRAPSDHSVHKFVVSQQRYASAYASEGVKAFASWTNSRIRNVELDKSAHMVAVDNRDCGLLSSPLLRPRAEKSDIDDLKPVAADSAAAPGSSRRIDHDAASERATRNGRKPLDSQQSSHRDNIKRKSITKKVAHFKPSATMEVEETAARMFYSDFSDRNDTSLFTDVISNHFSA